MEIERRQTLPLASSNDVVLVRQLVRQMATETDFSLIEQTKIVTAASEIARNTLIHGGGGSMEAQKISLNSRRGVKLIFTDQGPGIENKTQAMEDGFTSGNGLGLGLGGARRLVNEFDLSSSSGVGTIITLIRWKA